MIGDALKGAVEGLIRGIADIWARLWKRREEKTNEYLKAEIRGLRRGNAALHYKLRAVKPKLRTKKNAAKLPPGNPES